MKNTLLYLLLFTYSASILKPSLPYFSDVIAHTFYYAEHVKTVHFENGKYHVHHELVKQVTKNNQNDHEGYSKKISLPDEHLTVSNSFNFNPLYHNNYFLPRKESILQFCRNAIYPPPRS